MILGIFPIAFAFFYSVIFICIIIYKKQRLGFKTFKKWTAIGFIVIVYFFYPTITRSVMSLFFCTDVDGILYLKADLSQ